jgi:phosphinothricin acetyltransferase
MDGFLYQIRALTFADWEDVSSIYREGIETGLATFETEVPSWEQWDLKHLPNPRLVAEDKTGRVVGWAALSPVSARSVYRGVAEVSVYVAQECRGKGIGRQLLNALIEQSEGHGIWTLQSSMFRENSATRSLHKACGFREVGIRERIGELDGAWRDTVLMERRSSVVGKEQETNENRNRTTDVIIWYGKQGIQHRTAFQGTCGSHPIETDQSDG